MNENNILTATNGFVITFYRFTNEFKLAYLASTKG